MKSLEIVDELYDKVKHLCEYYYTDGRWSYEKEIFANKVMKSMNDLIENLQKEQTRLEVLEIIKKYMKLASGVSYSGDFSEGVAYNLVHFEDIDDMDTKEDFNKVKQWLEKEEN